MLRRVLNGIDRTELMEKVLKGKRLAIVTGGAAVDRELKHVVDVLFERYDVYKLFNMIYGIQASFATEKRLSYMDFGTGCQFIVSLTASVLRLQLKCWKILTQ